ncbi:MAG: AMP-binding protein [Methanobacteriaceae archaeon]|nr:AMP-binding protein [Methanobacteriaceae archaeon]
MTGQILVTGATGFLGTQIMRRLIGKNMEIMVLVRGKTYEKALNHLKRSWMEWPELLEAIGKEIKLIKGDVIEPNLGIDKKVYGQLIKNLSYIINCAADLRLDASLEELRKINVNGTSHLIELSKKAHEDHGFGCFVHISTAYVAGKREGPISEESLSDDYGFSSNYEQSKYESELVVRNSKVPHAIIRPGMIVGDSKTGYIKTFNTIYVLLRLYLNQKLRVVPVDSSLKINLIPVDYLAEAVNKLTFDKGSEGKTYHLTAPYQSLPTIKELVEFMNKWAYEKLNIKISRPFFIKIPSRIIKGLDGVKKYLNPGNKRLIETIITLSPYFNENRVFIRDNAEEILGPYLLDWKEFLPNLLEFAVHYGFFHRSSRTVHEQIIFRLESSSRPVKYYDIINGESIKISSLLVKENIIKAIKSLKYLGIKKGDRVALVGHNSTRYLILDVAIGMCGAVSVPIYYTSPMDEIKHVIRDSDSKILFIGSNEIWDNINSDEMDVKMVSFIDKDESLKESALKWKEFLEVGKDEKWNRTAPVNFNDVATIRYTSGTTDKPRGVVFDHGNIRWMAETLASLPPWRDRNHEVSYLSFLPMNHVVEGILGTYSPYYAPAPLKLYFLENFHHLKYALPKVKPIIFFSVPRFYEKVFSQITSNLIGQLYQKSRKNYSKKILGKILKWLMLRKTGLSKCSQLIVGSAAVSEDLLTDYHELGVEVHNAYGLTEAPLVTINRVGVNRIGTVGQPLPETLINIDSNGEIMVKGPQVAQSYFNIDSSHLFSDGWLLTGDYGVIDSEGYLTITGRKKEVIINSYGKTINPLKIEALIRDIPNISEAMVIGDKKPYCSAILWIEKGLGIDFEKIDHGIIYLNSKLSNPEQIKKWAVLYNDLSIESGDLTANMKLKRKLIIERYQDIVNNIYEDQISPEIIHSGEMRIKDEF